MRVSAKGRKNGSAQTHRPGRGRRRRRAGRAGAGRRGAPAGGWRRGAERARELFTPGEGEECVRPPAAPNAGGCGSPPRRCLRPGPSELRAPVGEGAGGSRAQPGRWGAGARGCVWSAGLGWARGGEVRGAPPAASVLRSLGSDSPCRPRGASSAPPGGERRMEREGGLQPGTLPQAEPSQARDRPQTAALVLSVGCLSSFDMTT